MTTYKTIEELNADQIEELKKDFVFDIYDDEFTKDYVIDYVLENAEIFNKVFYNFNEGREFTDDDFFCTSSKEEA